jgi:hypothetical protein
MNTFITYLIAETLLNHGFQFSKHFKAFQIQLREIGTRVNLKSILNIKAFLKWFLINDYVA